MSNDPFSDAEFHKMRALMHGYTGAYNIAVQEWTEYLRINPGDADAYAARGLAYSCLDRYEEGLADCDEALRLDPSYAQAYANRALVPQLGEDSG